jgi:hypothetical protein
MFDISENGKEAVISYIKNNFKNKHNTKSASKNFDNELGKPINKSKLQNIIQTKSLIVKL